MAVWWGLAGLLGLLGCCGLLRSHRADGAAVEDDPLARYPAAREPATPNADAAHTPLMTPAITPEMLARPALPRPDEAVPESGRMVGEIPAPRPQSGAAEVPAGAPAGVSAVSGGVRPAPGVSGAPLPSQQAPVAAMPRAVAQPAAAARRAVQPVAESAPEQVSPVAHEQPAEVRAPQPRTAEVPQQPKHALRAEEPAPETRPEPELEPVAKETSPPERNSRGLVGRLKRLLRRT